mgnify:CR=1 FL=1
MIDRHKEKNNPRLLISFRFRSLKFCTFIAILILALKLRCGCLTKMYLGLLVCVTHILPPSLMKDRGNGALSCKLKYGVFSLDDGERRDDLPPLSHHFFFHLPRFLFFFFDLSLFSNIISSPP